MPESAGDPPTSDHLWPRYDERDIVSQSERRWIASEIQHLSDTIRDLKDTANDEHRRTAEWRAAMDARVRLVEQRHAQEDAVKHWAGRIFAMFWILIGVVVGKAVEYFLSHRPMLAALGVSAVLLAASEIGDAAEYYVAETGSNTAAGTLEAPWATINYAATRVTPGDIVYVKTGTYRESIRTTVSGLPNFPITYRSDVSGGAKIYPPANNTSEVAWDASGGYLEIAGFEVDGGQYLGGVRWKKGVSFSGVHETVRDTTVHDIGRQAACSESGYGIGTEPGAAYVMVLANTVRDVGPTGGC